MPFFSSVAVQRPLGQLDAFDQRLQAGVGGGAGVGRHRVERALQIVGDIEHVAREAGDAVAARIGDLRSVRRRRFSISASVRSILSLTSAVSLRQRLDRPLLGIVRHDVGLRHHRLGAGRSLSSFGLIGIRCDACSAWLISAPSQKCNSVKLFVDPGPHIRTPAPKIKRRSPMVPRSLPSIWLTMRGGIIHHRDDPGIVEPGRADHAQHADDTARRRRDRAPRMVEEPDSENSLFSEPMKMRTPSAARRVRADRSRRAWSPDRRTAAARARDLPSAWRSSSRLAWPRTISWRSSLLAAGPAGEPGGDQLLGQLIEFGAACVSAVSISTRLGQRPAADPRVEEVRRLDQRRGRQPGRQVRTRFSTWPSSADQHHQRPLGFQPHELDMLEAGRWTWR